MKNYPKILQRSSGRSVRFGNIPINGDLYADSPLGYKYWQVVNGRNFGIFKFDFIPYDVISFSKLFWGISQLKLQFIGYKKSPDPLIPNEKGEYEIKVEPIQEEDLNKFKIPVSRIALGTAAEAIGITAKKNVIQYPQRYVRNFRIKKKGYLNNNKNSIILGKRVLMPEFEVDEKDKAANKITSASLKFTNYINQIEYDKLSTDFGNAEFTHANHMIAGGPLITNMLSLASSKTNNSSLSFNLNKQKEIKENTIKTYHQKAKKQLGDEKNEYGNRKSIDQQIKNKQEENVKLFLENLEKNIQGYGRGIFIDCSAYFFRPNFIYDKKKNKQTLDREDYKGKENGILGKYIKKRHTNTVYYPFVYVYLAGVLDKNLLPVGQGASNYGEGVSIGDVLIPWKEELALLEQNEKQKDIEKPSFEKDVEYGFSMYPVELREDKFQGAKVEFVQSTFIASPAPWGLVDTSTFDVKFPTTLKISPILDWEGREPQKKEIISPGGAAEVFFRDNDIPNDNRKKIV